MTIFCGNCRDDPYGYLNMIQKITPYLSYIDKGSLDLQLFQVKRSTVCTLIHFGICFVCSHLDTVQSAKVSGLMVVFTLLHSTFDTLVTRFHLRSLLNLYWLQRYCTQREGFFASILHEIIGNFILFLALPPMFCQANHPIPNLIVLRLGE